MNGAKKIKTIRHKSALPLYAAAAAFLLWALITPIYRLAFILIGAALSAAVWVLSKRFFPDRVEEYEVEEYTGDEELDKQIKFARELNKRIGVIADETPEGDIKTCLSRIIASTDLIVEDVVRDTTGRNDTYTFFSYYLPTLDKLLSFYTANMGEGANAVETKRRIANSLSMVAGAFEKQADRMYRNEVMDVKTDIAVMETMLKSEGLIDKQQA